MDKMERLRDLIHQLNDGDKDWEYRLWRSVREGMRSYLAWPLLTLNACDAVELHALSRASGGWFVGGVFIGNKDRDAQFSAWND